MLAFDFDQISPTQLGIAALIVTSILIYVASKRQRNPEAAPKAQRRELDEAAAEVRTLHGDLATLINELESLSARLSADAAARQEQMQSLIAQADERIAALQSQLATPAPGRTIVSGGVGTSSLGPLPSLRSIVAPASKASVGGSGTDDRHQAIYSLADEGLTPVEIAQRIGQRVGEVELILNLRPRPASPRRPI